jgi:hypothetical protein
VCWNTSLLTGLTFSFLVTCSLDVPCSLYSADLGLGLSYLCGYLLLTVTMAGLSMSSSSLSLSLFVVRCLSHNLNPYSPPCYLMQYVCVRKRVCVLRKTVGIVHRHRRNYACSQTPPTKIWNAYWTLSYTHVFATDLTSFFKAETILYIHTNTHIVWKPVCKRSNSEHATMHNDEWTHACEEIPSSSYLAVAQVCRYV